MGTARSSNMAVTCLKSSEYRGDQNTAVARRSVFLKQQEIQSKKAAQAAAAPAAHKKGKGSNKSAKGLPESRAVRKLEAHPAATPSLSEVLYVEAWGEKGDKLAQNCQVGDLVSIQGAALVAAPAQYSTSRLHYHFSLKGPQGLQVIVQKLDEDPWPSIPAVHPLVPGSKIGSRSALPRPLLRIQERSNGRPKMVQHWCAMLLCSKVGPE